MMTTGFQPRTVQCYDYPFLSFYVHVYFRGRSFKMVFSDTQSFAVSIFIYTFFRVSIIFWRMWGSLFLVIRPVSVL